VTRQASDNHGSFLPGIWPHAPVATEIMSLQPVILRNAAQAGTTRDDLQDTP